MTTDDRNTARPDIQLQDLIPEFIQNRHKEIPQLEGYLQTRDFDSIRRLGHTLKGICASYGFNYLGVLGKQLEEAAVQKELPRLNEIFTEMKAHLVSVKIVYAEEN